MGAFFALPPSQAAEPWHGGPFTASPAALREAAAALTTAADAPAVILYRDVSYKFDDDGKVSYRQHLVYSILHPSALAAFAASEVSWAPWHQGPPRIRARVVAVDGTARWLDALAVDEALLASGAGTARRVVRVPLPGVAVGAVVEEEVEVRDATPYFVAGQSFVHRLVGAQPILSGRLVLEAPTSLPLRYGVRLMPGLEPRRTVADGRVRLQFDYTDRSAASAVEPAMPPHLPRHPQVVFATGADWRTVAERYAKELAPGLDASTLREAFDLPALTRLAHTERVARLLAAVRSTLRWSAEELDARGVLPRPVAEVWKERRGSRLELTTVLVALLRAVEVPAFTALVRSGWGRDIEANLPGLGGFNHPLVFIPAARPLWLDPSDSASRVGQLDVALEGRLALVVSPTTEALIRIPTSGAADNRTVLQIDVFLAPEGPARIVETSEYHGVPERTQRRLSQVLTAEERRLGYADYVKTAYKAAQLGAAVEGDPTDFSRPYSLRLEALNAGRALTEGGQAAVGLPLSDLLLTLPAPFLIQSAPRRRHDFLFPYPSVVEWRYRIMAPPGMAPKALPQDEIWSLGTVRLSQRFRFSDGILYADFRLDSGPRLLTPEEFETVRFKVGEFLRVADLVLELE